MAFRSTAIERMLGTGKEKVQRFKGSNAPDGAGSNKVQ
jgi:hypothetical protein